MLETKEALLETSKHKPTFGFKLVSSNSDEQPKFRNGKLFCFVD